jgi:hypothetical protein
MNFRSPSRISSASRSALPGRPTAACPSSRPFSHGVRHPSGAPSPGNPSPGAACSPDPCRRLSPPVVGRSSRLGSHLGDSAVPRRGLPPPRRSACVVSRDLDGLLPPGPCGVFRPLTPLRSGAPAPRQFARLHRPEGRCVRTRGAGFRYEALLVDSVRPVDVAEAPSPSANGIAASTARAAAPASRSPRAYASPPIGTPPGCPDVRLPASPVRDVPAGLPRPFRPVRAAAAASCHDPCGPTPLQGLPSSYCPDLPAPCYRGRRSVPPGTNRTAARANALHRSIRLPGRPSHLSMLRSPMSADFSRHRPPSPPRRVVRVFDRRVPAPRTRFEVVKELRVVRSFILR